VSAPAESHNPRRVVLTLRLAPPRAQAAANNFAGLAALRVLSGAFEAIADPAFMLITTQYYTREEQPWRISSW
jgi:MFS family permease